MLIHFLKTKREKQRKRVCLVPATKNKNAVYGEDVREVEVAYSIPFEVHEHERVQSVALRWAKAEGLPRPPPNVIATLTDAPRCMQLSPTITIGEAVKSGSLLFTLSSQKEDRHVRPADRSSRVHRTS